MRVRFRWPSFKGLDWLVVGIGLAGFTAALLLIHLHPIGYLGVETDFYGGYAKMARKMLGGEGLSAPHAGPGYPVLLGVVSLIVGDVFTAGKFITAVATLVLIWMSYDLLRSFFDRAVAAAAGLLLALMLLPFSYLAATDVPGAVFGLAPLWIVLRKGEPTLSSWLTAGCLAGVAYLFRYNYVFVIAAVPLTALILGPENVSWKRRGVRVAISLAGTFLVISPWIAYSWTRHGSPFAGTAHLQVAAHFFHPDDDLGTSLTQMAGQFDSLWQVLAYDPARVAMSYTQGLYRNSLSLLQEGLRFPALIFAGGGLFILSFALSRRVAAFLLWAVLGYALLGLVGFHLRYYLFLFPVLSLLVAASLFPDQVLTDERKAPGSKGRWSWVFLLAIAALSAYGVVRRVTDDLTRHPLYVLEMADVLRGRADFEDKIISRKPHLGYHSELTGVFPLAESAAEFRLAAEESGARFLEYSDHAARLWPGLAEFADPASVVHLGFHALYESADGSAILYEFEPPSRQGDVPSR